LKQQKLPVALTLAFLSQWALASNLTPPPSNTAQQSRAGPEQQASAASGVQWAALNRRKLNLRSEHVLVMDERGRVVYGKAFDESVAIASITKLMTAMVVLDAEVPMDERITIRQDDKDRLRLTGSRLQPEKARLKRRELLRLALMSSENRAAAALTRTTFPGGTAEFVARMNRKAAALGMHDTVFADGTGLDSRNRSTARDLVRLVRAADSYEFIRQATTTRSAEVRPYANRGSLRYVNTNRLLKNGAWAIELSKTGYINESGRCLVMKAAIADQTLYIVLLNSFGKLTPFGDSNRLRKWLEAELRNTG